MFDSAITQPVASEQRVFSWYWNRLGPAIVVALVALGVVLLPWRYSWAPALAVTPLMVGELLHLRDRHDVTVLKGAFLVSSVALIFLVVGFSYAIVLTSRFAGAERLAIVIFATYGSDVLALYGGRFCASHGGVIGTRLAPRISPNKTVARVVCGLIGALAVASLIAAIFGLPRTWPLLLASVAIFSLLGVSGDLLESYVKRRVGVKDSSHILGAHGGVLDRNDALMVAMPIALVLFAVGLF